jgi:murein DD-endopeptidase MepM/ murein hydrolase activator NlpD
VRRSFFFITLLFVTSCASLRELPKEQHYEFIYSFNEIYQNDTLAFNIKNPLQCPVSIRIAEDSTKPNLEVLFGLITLEGLQDTLLNVYYPNLDLSRKSKISYIVRYGNLNKQIEKNQISLPFPKGREYEIIQGYNGKFTHNNIFSQFAIDFNLKVGDTISSADEGYVVGIIEDYKVYGTSKKWRENDKSNFITVYHPHSGLFTQYVHLKHKGALVKLGDFVKRGQPLAISGMTGFTTTPHLHFNVKIPSEKNGLISTDFEFENGVSGKDLKKKNRVK